MNRIHDMGGKTRAVFCDWERHIYAILTAVQATGKLRLGLRAPIESMSPIDYLSSSYYEERLVSITERTVASDLVTDSSGKEHS
jgi:hypothetical protein